MFGARKLPVPKPPKPPVTDSDIKVERTEEIIKANLRFENIPWYTALDVKEYDADPPWEGGRCVNINGWHDISPYSYYGAVNIPISILKQIMAEYDEAV